MLRPGALYRAGRRRIRLPALALEPTPRFDGIDDRASVAESSMCGDIAHTAVAVDQNAEPERHNKGISHALSSCMPITPKTDHQPGGKAALFATGINRNSLPIPRLSADTASRSALMT